VAVEGQLGSVTQGNGIFVIFDGHWEYIWHSNFLHNDCGIVEDE